jgi:hypothetical protein
MIDEIELLALYQCKIPRFWILQSWSFTRALYSDTDQN